MSARSYGLQSCGKLEKKWRCGTRPSVASAARSGRQSPSILQQTFNVPGEITRTTLLEKIALFSSTEIQLQVDEYETKQVSSIRRHARAMFPGHKKGLRLDGNNPTLLNGYGASSLIIIRSSSFRLALLSRALFMPQPNRGGGEYGGSGMKPKETEETELVRRFHRGPGLT